MTAMPRTDIIDVSHHNDAIDWSAQNVRGGIAKATQGIHFIDPQFGENIAAIADAGLITGAYHFAQIERDGTLVQAVDEAEHFLSELPSPAPPILALDWERQTGIDALGSAHASAAWIDQWIAHVTSAVGVVPLLYIDRINLQNLASVLSSDTDIWLAEWQVDKPAAVHDFKPVLWQYQSAQLDRSQVMDETWWAETVAGNVDIADNKGTLIADIHSAIDELRSLVAQL
jgi:lysozyme